MYVPNHLSAACSIRAPREDYGQISVFSILPVNFSSRLRAKRQFSGFARKMQPRTAFFHVPQPPLQYIQKRRLPFSGRRLPWQISDLLIDAQFVRFVLQVICNIAQVGNMLSEFVHRCQNLFGICGNFFSSGSIFLS